MTRTGSDEDSRVMMDRMVALNYLDEHSETYHLCWDHDGVGIISKRFGEDGSKERRIDLYDFNRFLTVEVQMRRARRYST